MPKTPASSVVVLKFDIFSHFNVKMTRWAMIYL